MPCTKNVVRAELATLARRKVLVATGLATAALAVVSTLATFLSAEATPGPADGRGATLESLARSGGGTEAFSLGIGFLGLLILVAFTTRLAGEFSYGTLRTVLMKEPRRLRVVLGKFIALVGFMAALLLLAEALSFVASVVIAPTQDVDTANWYSLNGLGDAAGDYAAALAGTSAWALYGMTLALLLRSVAIAVAVGVAWAGPLEHITAESWQTAERWFPGLQLETLASGGANDLSYERAHLLTGIYATLAVAAGLITLSRRDISG
jgi:ABC-2 type transport system permease protein